jgi:hypothetical protein
VTPLGAGRASTPGEPPAGRSGSATPSARSRAPARIEQAVGALKRFKRIALRCEKTKTNFASCVVIATGFILVQFVHTAQRP